VYESLHSTNGSLSPARKTIQLGRDKEDNEEAIKEKTCKDCVGYSVSRKESLANVPIKTLKFGRSSAKRKRSESTPSLRQYLRLGFEYKVGA